MNLRRIGGILLGVAVLGAAGWLLRDWYQVYGMPARESRVVVTASRDAVLSVDNGEVVSTSGRSVRASLRNGFWLWTNAAPLAVIVAVAMVPCVRLARRRKAT